jgi:hypothetical protein
MRTTLLNGYLSHDRWETFTSNDVSSNFSSFIGATGGFEGVIPSSIMIESSHALTKTKKIT